MGRKLDNGGVLNKHVKLYYGAFTVTLTENTLSVAIDGYETRDCPGGDVILVETGPATVTGSPVVYLWANVNQEDSTHKISMQNAHESLFVDPEVDADGSG